MISRSPAVRRELEKFERMQIWTFDPKIEELAADQADRMQKEFRTRSIPLHVILSPDGKELARFVYKGGLSSPEDYLKFLGDGMAKFEASRPR
jgi:hypothetical protein